MTENLYAEKLKNKNKNWNSADKLTQARKTETDKLLRIKFSQHYSIFQSLGRKKLILKILFKILIQI
ncbi:hypothetical protein GCM10008088_28830 [Mesonia mobilis]|uniref:Uncharacterized protein n=1 Tax=Mesonia mobilis TaxID=369791 RepID=A0ABQ3C6U2_9FLAO|nr:hypothetical protein GCM10008088_28830 [Mesonia mobilis]